MSTERASCFLDRSRRFRRWLPVLVVALLAVETPEADAHRGRRFAVELVGDKLQAQGVNTGPDDGLPAVRPYANTIHDHWRNVDPLVTALSTLPGFDVPGFVTPLVGHELTLDLVSVRKWENPPLMPPAATMPRLKPLGAGEFISIIGPVGETDSAELGGVTLSSEIRSGGALDLDLVYQINALPENEIHVLEFILSAAPASGVPTTIRPSDPIYVLLSPDGATPAERLHHASLFLETHLATIPEPTSGALLAIALPLVLRTRRRVEC